MSEAATSRSLPLTPGGTRLLSDERLARRASDGDQRAFAAIYRRYHQALYRYCLAIVGDPQDAQDALQNAMLKAMRALPGERRRIQLKPWLYRIAHNESIDLLRRRRAADPLDPELTAPGPGLSEKTEQRERLRRLMVDLDDLPERQRGALVMRELAGLDFEQIGAALEASPAVVRQTIYEARLNLSRMEAGREMSCDAVTRSLSDADGRTTRRRDIRAHLRGCRGCRAFQQQIRARQDDFASLAPLPAGLAAALLGGILGGGGGASGGGVAAALGGGAGVSVGSSIAVKAAATAALVGAVGIGAADRGGLIDAGLPGSGGASSKMQSAEDSTGSTAGAGGSGHAGNGVANLSGGRRPAAAEKPGSRSTGLTGDRASDRSSVLPAGGRRSASSPGATGRGAGRPSDLPAASSRGQATAAGHKRGAQAKGSANGHASKGSANGHASKGSKGAKQAQPSKSAKASPARANSKAKAPAKSTSSPAASEAAADTAAEPRAASTQPPDTPGKPEPAG